MTTLDKVARGGFFLVAFYTASYFSSLKTCGAPLSYRPPGPVFGGAWALISIAVAAAWAFSSLYKETVPQWCVDAAFVLLSALLVSYMVVPQSCNGPVGLYLIWASFFVSLAAYTMLRWPSKAGLVPLLAWLLFAARMQGDLVCGSCGAAKGPA
jgi:tryptophan-rich sensory protein